MNETKQRLLESACEVFSQKGFTDATVADICQVAQANIAAVNYHFGSKENLYGEVVDYAYELARKEFPPDGGLPLSAPPEQRLKALLLALLNRIFNEGPAGFFQKLVVHEFSSETSRSEVIFERIKSGDMHVMKGIMDDMAGPDVSEECRRLCGLNTISMCVIFAFNKFARLKFKRHHDLRLEDLAEHISKYAMAGIQEIFNSPERPIK